MDLVTGKVKDMLHFILRMNPRALSKRLDEQEQLSRDSTSNAFSTATRAREARDKRMELIKAESRVRHS